MKTCDSQHAESHQQSTIKTLVFCGLTGFHELTLTPEHLRERAAAAGEHLLHGCGRGEGQPPSAGGAWTDPLSTVEPRRHLPTRGFGPGRCCVSLTPTVLS